MRPFAYPDDVVRLDDGVLDFVDLAAVGPDRWYRTFSPPFRVPDGLGQFILGSIHRYMNSRSSTLCRRADVVLEYRVARSATFS